MKIWGRRLSFAGLFVIAVSALWVLMLSNLHDVRHKDISSRPQRHSFTLKDDFSTYHLNFTQYEAEFPHLQSYNCTLLVDKPGYCHSPGGKPLLLLAMKSHPASSDRRSALRQTWAVDRDVSGYQVKPLFLMATVPSRGHMALVKEESNTFQDILLWDFTESHHNLSLKERCFLEWLHHNCKEAEFIFKGDDDMLVNPDALIKYVKTIDNASCCLHGAVQHHSVVVRSGKYGVTHSLFPLPKYPHFVSGGGFLVPGAVVTTLFHTSLKLPVFPLDDVYLGMLALAANIKLRDSRLFFVFGLKYETCPYKAALAVHGITADHLLKIWKEMQETECEPVFKWNKLMT
ncbi:beta-1,3-galactosyltransferase 5-like isoform X2 [Lissotriton helveticus]